MMASSTSATTSTIEGPWLHAWQDSLANIKTTSSCLRLGDLNGDGDSKLCVCDMDKKLRVFKGTSQVVEYALLDIPVAMCLVYMEHNLPKFPSIAVAAGSHVYIYRQLRPYKKWTCPPMEVSIVEENIWKELQDGTLNASGAIKQLINIRDNNMNSGNNISKNNNTTIKLTNRSLELLTLDASLSESKIESKSESKNNNESKSNSSGRGNNDAHDSRIIDFIQLYKDIPLQNSSSSNNNTNSSNTTLITCMEVLKKDSDEPDGICLLVVGTESCQVYLLPQDPNGSQILSKVELPSPPVQMSVTGLYDIEWRITVSCRDGKLYYIKNGDIRGTVVLSGAINDLGAMAVSIARQDKNVWVATMDRNLACYSLRGKKSINIMFNNDDGDISEICGIDLKRSKYNQLMLIAFVSGEIKLYHENKQVHSFTVDPPVLALRFGAYGREENCLVIVHGKGTVTAKIWRRTTDLEALKNISLGPPIEQDTPLAIPKKTKLFVEQTQRERDNSAQMHRTFQRDLCKIRLETARAYVKTLGGGGQMPTSSSAGSADLRLHVHVQGLGPSFLLKISLQNSGSQPLIHGKIMLRFDDNIYTMKSQQQPQHSSVSGSGSQSISLPAILPGPKYVVQAEVKCIDPSGRSGQILVLVHSPNSNNSNSSSSSQPLLSASVRMPVSELLDM